MHTSSYPKFDHEAKELSAFSFSVDTFIISLKNGQIVHFIADDVQQFKAWLTKNDVRDIRKDDGIPQTFKVVKVERN
ncbi:MAG: hypothetical protein J0L80_08880 [Chitinophagales bacterium]|nr:hypothetical protein [Chitinophagales bacterium]